MLTENSPLISSGSPTALSAPAAGTRDGTSSVVRNGESSSIAQRGPTEALFTDIFSQRLATSPSSWSKYTPEMLVGRDRKSRMDDGHGRPRIRAHFTLHRTLLY